jgi:putative transposase
MRRTIQLQTDATNSKINILNNFSRKTLETANIMLSNHTSKYLMDLHKKMYSACKKDTSLNSQVICDIERSVNKTKCKNMKGITIKFNCPRNCKIFMTKKYMFIRFSLYTKKQIAIPIRQNKNYIRFQELLNNGWKCKTYGLTPDQQIVAFLSKEKKIFPHEKNALGIDINSKHFAISILSPDGKILYQTYFGKHIWTRRKQIMKRRAILQSTNKRKSLKKIRRYQKNFVKTNIGQIISNIIKIAQRFDADISIENLKQFRPKSKTYNKNVLHIPFYQFKQILEQRCFDNDIHLNIVDSWHTSKWCSHCGAVGKGHSANYSIFKCEKCGQTVNSDRKASLSIAVKSLMERSNKHTLNKSAFFQFSNRRVPVNGLICSNEVVDLHSVNHNQQQMESHLTS